MSKGVVMLRDYIIYSERIGSKVPSLTGVKPDSRPIAVIDYSRVIEFLTELRDAPKIPLRIKAYIAVALSGGLRVSEVLSLKRSDFNLATRDFRVSILKKRSVAHRDCVLFTVALEILQRYLDRSPIGENDLVFPIERSGVYRQMRRIFGDAACCHMWRHSHFTYLLHCKHLSTEMVSSLLKVQPEIVKYYNHANSKKEYHKVIA